MKLLLKVVLRIIFIQTNQQYILQDSGGGHIGFMHEQDLKFNNDIRKDKWCYTSFSDDIF